MPHLTLEYSDNLPTFDAAAALMALNHTLVASGQFEEVDIKSRALRFDTYLVGTQPTGRAFVHAKIAILSGRTPETKAALSSSLLATLRGLCTWPATLQVQLCVEVQDIDRPSYAKDSVG